MTRKNHCTEQELTLYYYDELAPTERQEVQRRLDDCADCRKQLDLLQRDLAKLPDPAAALSTEERQQFARKVLQRKPRPFWSQPAFSGAMAALAVLLIVVVWQPLQPMQQKSAIPPTPEVAEVAMEAVFDEGTPVPTDSTMVAELDGVEDIEFIDQMELLSNLELLKNLELLQEFES